MFLHEPITRIGISYIEFTYFSTKTSEKFPKLPGWNVITTFTMLLFPAIMLGEIVPELGSTVKCEI